MKIYFLVYSIIASHQLLRKFISLLIHNTNDMQNKRLAFLLGILIVGLLCLMVTVYVQAKRQKRENSQRVISEAEENLRMQTYKY